MRVKIVPLDEQQGFTPILTLELGDVVLEILGLVPDGKYTYDALVYPEHWEEDFKPYLVEEEVTYDPRAEIAPMIKLYEPGGGHVERSASVLIYQPLVAEKIDWMAGRWKCEDGNSYLVCPGCRAIAVAVTDLSPLRIEAGMQFLCEMCQGLVVTTRGQVWYVPNSSNC
jgi:hypothetical protein